MYMKIKFDLYEKQKCCCEKAKLLLRKNIIPA